MNPTPPINGIYCDNDLLQSICFSADVAVIAIGRNAGEGRDRKVENDFNLSDTERRL